MGHDEAQAMTKHCKSGPLTRTKDAGHQGHVENCAYHEQAENDKRSDQTCRGEQKIGDVLIGQRTLTTSRDSKRKKQAYKWSDYR
jgi:hypothetical protein